MEWRRLRAWGLKQQGWAQCDIAEALGVTKESVSRWVNRAREGGSRTPVPSLRSVHGPD